MSMRPALIPAFCMLAWLLPEAQYALPGQTITTRFWHTYPGIAIGLAMAGALLFSLIASVRKKRIPASWWQCSGLFLLGFVVFRAYHVFALFHHRPAGSVAASWNASSMPGSGLWVLFLGTMLWVLTGGIPRLYRFFNPA